MSSIHCNPEEEYCGTESQIQGGFWGSIDPATAKFWYGWLALANLVVTDYIAWHAYQEQAWVNQNKRGNRNRDSNSADWAWNLMVIWHTVIFFFIFEFWALGIFVGHNPLFKYLFLYLVNFSMAGPYGVYEIIASLIAYSVVTDENATDQDYDMLLWYLGSAIVTGFLQLKLHKGVVEYYYLDTQAWLTDGPVDENGESISEIDGANDTDFDMGTGW